MCPGPVFDPVGFNGEQMDSAAPWERTAGCVHLLSPICFQCLKVKETAMERHRASDLWVRKTSQVRIKVELDANPGSGQGEPSDQQHNQHQIWKSRSEVNHLHHTCISLISYLEGKKTQSNLKRKLSKIVKNYKKIDFLTTHSHIFCALNTYMGPLK